MSWTVRLVLASAVLALVAAPAAAQDTLPPIRNAIYVEAGGNAGLFSVNYERMLTGQVAARVGLAALGGGGGDNETSIFIVPVMVSYLAGRGVGKAEIGVGGGYSSGQLDFGELGDVGLDGGYATATLGYRLQRPDGGFVFRIGFTPLLINGDVWPWIGASFGHAF
jgi:hypothetical protein